MQSNPNQPVDKDKFVKEITDAINDWMLKQYPMFDSNLTEKIENLNQEQKRVHNIIADFKNGISNIKKQVIDDINKFLENEYPDISNNLKILAEKLKKDSEKVDDRLKKIVQSDSLCEDVYKMRDEMKEIKTFLEGFKKKVKKAFEI